MTRRTRFGLATFTMLAALLPPDGAAASVPPRPASALPAQQPPGGWEGDDWAEPDWVDEQFGSWAGEWPDGWDPDEYWVERPAQWSPVVRRPAREHHAVVREHHQVTRRKAWKHRPQVARPVGRPPGLVAPPVPAPPPVVPPPVVVAPSVVAPSVVVAPSAARRPPVGVRPPVQPATGRSPSPVRQPLIGAHASRVGQPGRPVPWPARAAAQPPVRRTHPESATEPDRGQARPDVGRRPRASAAPVPTDPAAESVPRQPAPALATPTAQKHRLAVGVQVGLALFFLYLVLVCVDRRFLIIRRRPRELTPHEPDVGLGLLHDAPFGAAEEPGTNAAARGSE